MELLRLVIYSWTTKKILNSYIIIYCKIVILCCIFCSKIRKFPFIFYDEIYRILIIMLLFLLLLFCWGLHEAVIEILYNFAIYCTELDNATITGKIKYKDIYRGMKYIF